MATTTQIRIDTEVKAQAVALFNELGLDLSTAITIFLHQCVLHNGLPFSVALPHYQQELLDAVEETKRIAHDPHTPHYDSMEVLHQALMEE